MRLLYILFICALCSLTVYAQERQYSTTSKEAIKDFALANGSLDQSMYDEAIAQLQQAIEADNKFIEAHDLLADVLRKMRLHKQALAEYLKVIELNPEFSRAVYLKAGEEELTQSQYKEAQQHLEKYLTYPDITAQNNAYAQKLINDCKFSLLAIAHPVPFKPVNMGEEINTPDDEYLPVATADESTLIFTRKIANNEDFYQSEKVDNKWETATYLSNHINTPNYNEGAQSISQDGKILFFTGCNRPDGLRQM